MSQNNFYNRNGYYDKSSYRSDIDSFCLDNYPTRLTPSIAACGAASDLSYRRDLIRLRQKLEERHNRIMQEKAAFQMFNEFKENFFKTYGDTLVSAPTPTPVQSNQQQLLNLQAFPEKETYGLNSAYSSNVDLSNPLLSTPTVLPIPVYPISQNVMDKQIPKHIPAFPTISLPEDSGYDTTTKSIAKYIEHIHNLESEKEVFETVVKALIEYQKRKTPKNNISHIKLIPEEKFSSNTSPKNYDMGSFKEEYIKKLDDVKTVAQEIKESVADFRQQLLCQKLQHNAMGDREVLTPVKNTSPVDNDVDIVTESKITNNSSLTKSYNSKGGYTVLNNIDYTLYENGMSNSTPTTPGGCRKNAEKLFKSESERTPLSYYKDNDVKPTITNEKCQTCHGYLMQKKYHEHLKHFDDTPTNETAHKFSSADHQLAERTPECKCIKDENAFEQNGDINILKNKPTLVEYDENRVSKNSQTMLYPLILKSKSDQCMKHSKTEYEKNMNIEKWRTPKNTLCCLHQNSPSTNQISHQCDSAVSKQYSTSKCYFEESKIVKCVVEQHDNRIDPTIISDDSIETTEDSIDADTIVSYFLKRVKDLKDQCRKYRCMKDDLQKRVEEYSGIYTKEKSLFC